jgi:hypothetical protein
LDKLAEVLDADTGLYFVVVLKQQLQKDKRSL